MTEPLMSDEAFQRPRPGDLVACTSFVLIAALLAFAASNAAQDADWVRTAQFGAVAIVFGVCAVLTLFRGAPISGRDGWRMRAIAVIGNLAIFPLAALPLTWEPEWLMTVTTLGIVAACLWIVWALGTLGRGFSVFPEARVLVTDGPYAIVRHPIYAATIVAYLLVALPRLSVVALMIAALGIASEVMRAKNEEHVLRSAIPTYQAYAEQVPQFFPGGRRETSPEFSDSESEPEHHHEGESLAA
jgi:protein-S-isoprenylcysteine O-methyltransferase Ste14